VTLLLRPAREGAPTAGKLETAALALVGLGRELDAEVALFRNSVEEARRVVGRSTGVPSR
jgi:hypothetical protein